jgi:hypothetical protein
MTAVNIQPAPAVLFDRRRRAYLVDGLDGQAWPAGLDGRAAAERAAILAASPAVYGAALRFIEKRPYAAARVWAAARLVLSGQVLQTGPAFLVMGAGGDYDLVEVDGVITCQCADFIRWGAPVDETGQRFCKHVIAAMLAAEVLL